MAYYRDLREYLAALEGAGKLLRVKRPISKDTQLSPLVRLQYRGLPEEERRAFLFENVTGSRGRAYDMPVAIGVLAGSRDIYALGMKCRPEEVSEKLAQAEMKPLAPRLVSSGPVQDVVHEGKDLMAHGGLDQFPIPIATPGFDPAPYITAPYWVTRDPETGTGNMGMYRAMVKSPTRTGLNFASPTKGAAVHLQSTRRGGRACPPPSSLAALRAWDTWLSVPCPGTSTSWPWLAASRANPWRWSAARQ